MTSEGKVTDAHRALALEMVASPWLLTSNPIAAALASADAAGYRRGQEDVAQWHEARADECDEVAKVNPNNDLSGDCIQRAIDHRVDADEIRALAVTGADNAG